MKIYLIFLILFTSSSFSCELTKEYRELRSSLRKEAYESYNECKDSTRSYFYYQAVAKCKAEGKGENVGGGCFHIVGYQQTYTEKDIEHCNIFKPTIEQMKKYLNFIVKRDNISKCMKHNKLLN